MKYMGPKMEVIELEAMDVITLSGDDDADDNGNNGGSNVPGASAGGDVW